MQGDVAASMVCVGAGVSVQVGTSNGTGTRTGELSLFQSTPTTGGAQKKN